MRTGKVKTWKYDTVFICSSILVEYLFYFTHSGTQSNITKLFSHEPYLKIKYWKQGGYPQQFLTKKKMILGPV